MSNYGFNERQHEEELREAVAAEREACAKVLDDLAAGVMGELCGGETLRSNYRYAASLIRARGEK